MMDLLARLEEYRAQEGELRWEGTFEEYFELVKANPRIARLSHARVFDMIMAAGVEQGGPTANPSTGSSARSCSVWTARYARSWSTSALRRSGWRCASASSS
jgi:predicted Ser/Thr protein kinase